MNTTNKIFLVVMTIMLGIGSTVQVHAVNPANIHSSLKNVTAAGIVDAVYPNKRQEIIISDQTFRVSPTLVVRSLSGRMLGGLAVLGPGKRVAYRTDTKIIKGAKGKFLVEAWLLPPDFKIPDEWQ